MNTINFNKYLGWLFTVLAFMAGVHTLVWLFKDPTLWLDDAMLMKSVVTRDFFGLFAGMLDYSQSAPIGWLLIVKTFETVFGNSPFVLRLTGVILYFISALLVYLLSKNTFKYQIPMMLSLCHWESFRTLLYAPNLICLMFASRCSLCGFTISTYSIRCQP